MNEYTAEDLIKIPWQPALFGRYSRAHLKELQRVVKLWLESPILKPLNTNSTWEDYKVLTKNAMLIRIRQKDWPDGLCMIQVAQLDELSARIVGTTNWNVWKLIPPKDTHLHIYHDKSVIKNRLQTHISDFFNGHVYCFEHEATKTTWYRIQLFVHSYQLSFPRTTITIVHFPKTEYLIFPKPARHYSQSISHCLLNAFNASSIKKQPLSNSSLNKLIEITEQRNALGVFTQFSALRSDPNQNPLLLSRTTNSLIKKQTESSSSSFNNNYNIYEQNTLAYTFTPEQNRRIIPIHQLQLKSRYNHIEDVFGKYPLKGSISLSIMFDLPITKLLHHYGITEPLEEEPTDDMKSDNKNNHDNIKRNKMEIDDLEEFITIFSDDTNQDSNSDSDYDDNNEDDNEEVIQEEREKQTKHNIIMNVKFSGKNVTEGLRQMAIRGYCDPPFPIWMAETINSGSTNIYVSKEEIILDYGEKNLYISH